MLSIAVTSGVTAQTLIQPSSPPKVPPPRSVSANSVPAGRVKSCNTFGAGFAQLPGTDACVKIGGYVTMEGTAR
jgi:hypothetical protein